MNILKTAGSKLLATEMGRNLLRRALRTQSQFSTNATSREDLRELIRSLHPVSTDHALIRVGSKGDGGYLVPDDLERIEACYSPGVSQVSDFELALANRGIRVFLADHSVDGPAVQHPFFDFSKRFVGGLRNDIFMTVDDWVRGSGVDPSSDLLMQMDIEGYEYETLVNMSPELLGRFRILVVEFHYLDQLANWHFFRTASRVFEKILISHACVHIHPNNCFAAVGFEGLTIPPVLEMTFYRRDRFVTSRPITEYPHPLDADNTPNPHLPLPMDWYASSSRSPDARKPELGAL